MVFTIDPASGGYRAHAWGNNGKLVWWTEVYTTKPAAQHAIDLIKTEGPSAEVQDRT
jgi:uncharacterized protein